MRRSFDLLDSVMVEWQAVRLVVYSDGSRGVICLGFVQPSEIERWQLDLVVCSARPVVERTVEHDLRQDGFFR